MSNFHYTEACIRARNDSVEHLQELVGADDDACLILYLAGQGVFHPFPELDDVTREAPPTLRGFVHPARAPVLDPAELIGLPTTLDPPPSLA